MRLPNPGMLLIALSGAALFPASSLLEAQQSSEQRGSDNIEVVAHLPLGPRVSDVEIEQRENALMVPESSLIYDRNGTYVWRVSPEKRVEKVPVEIGLRQKGRVQIVAGISSGDSVISAGTNKVLAGDFVEPIEAVRPAHASGKTEAEIPDPVGDET